MPKPHNLKCSSLTTMTKTLIWSQSALFTNDKAQMISSIFMELEIISFPNTSSKCHN